MAVSKEMVLYYNPDSSPDTARLKGVLVGMGVRIKNVTPGQVTQKVGFLAGLAGFEEVQTSSEPELPLVEEEVLVMKNFTSRRMDELLGSLRKAGVPKIRLKAIVTDTNSQWPFFELYREIKKEHETMTQKDS